jgi:hypothetical protein
MAFIVNGSEYHGQENMDINIRPRFFGTKPTEMGIRVIDARGASSVKLTFFGKLAKVLMPYVTGFQGGSVAEKLQKKLALAEFKAENAYDKHDYANMILEQIVNKGGVNQNDIQGTDVWNAEQAVFFNAVEADVFANFWLGDTAKVHINAGTYPDGTAYSAGDVDKYYNVIDGILKNAISDVYQSYISKQSAIAGWNKTTYPVLYLAEDSGTVYAYGSAADRTAGVSGTRLFSFAATNASYPASKALSELNSSGFTGSVQLEKANTSGSYEIYAAEWNYIKKIDLPDTLTTDTAETYMQRLLRLASPELRGLKSSGLLRFYVTDSVLFNYEDTLKSGTTESARNATIDGVQRYTIDGVPIIPMSIDQLIESDFAPTFPKDFILLTTPQNLCLVINGSSNFSETRFWFNPDVNENRQRTQFELGVNYILPELMAIAYKA